MVYIWKNWEARHRPLSAKDACFLILISVVVSILLLSAFPCSSLAESKELTLEYIFGEEPPWTSPVSAVQWRPDSGGCSFIEFVENGQADDSETETSEEAWLMFYDLTTRRTSRLISENQLESFFSGLSQAADGEEEGENDFPGLSGYTWAPHSGALLFTSTDGLYLYDIKTRALRAFGGTAGAEGPRFSPDSAHIAFHRDQNLFVLDLAGDTVIQLTEDGAEGLINGRLDWVHVEEFGMREAYFWSPDSKSLLFYRVDESGVKRYPIVDYEPPYPEVTFQHYPRAGCENAKIDIGVVSLVDRRIRWIDFKDLQDAYIPLARWTPDNRLFIQTMNRDQNQSRFLLSGKDGSGLSVVFQEQDRGWLDFHDDLYLFEKTGRLLRRSAQDGWTHLYLHDLDTGGRRQLTKGKWDVRRIEYVDETTETIYFSGTAGGADERHLYRIGMDGTGLRALTGIPGYHGIEFSPDGAFFIDTYSSYLQPPAVRVCGRKGEAWLQLAPEDRGLAASFGLSAPEKQVIKGAGGKPMFVSMLKPPDMDPEKRHPVLIYVYGGPDSQVVRNLWRGTIFLWEQMMARKGYIIFKVDGRGTGGRGKDFSRTVYQKLGEIELEDQLAGVEYLKSLPFVDPDRIGIWGWSYGGYMTCSALFNAPEVFKAGVAVAPVTDWRFYDTIYTERYMLQPEANEQGYLETSLIDKSKNLEAAFLLVHGLSDDNVHFQNSSRLIDALISSQKQFRLMIYPGRGHSIRDGAARQHLFTMITQFIENHL